MGERQNRWRWSRIGDDGQTWSTPIHCSAGFRQTTCPQDETNDWQEKQATSLPYEVREDDDVHAKEIRTGPWPFEWLFTWSPPMLASGPRGAILALQRKANEISIWAGERASCHDKQDQWGGQWMSQMWHEI